MNKRVVRYLHQEDHDKIRQLAKDGVPKKTIAKMFARPASSISYIIDNPDVKTIEMHRAMGSKGIQLKELEEIDLSSLPDTELFKHSKEGIL